MQLFPYLPEAGRLYDTLLLLKLENLWIPVEPDILQQAAHQGLGVFDQLFIVHGEDIVGGQTIVPMRHEPVMLVNIVRRILQVRGIAERVSQLLEIQRQTIIEHAAARVYDPRLREHGSNEPDMQVVIRPLVGKQRVVRKQFSHSRKVLISDLV